MGYLTETPVWTEQIFQKEFDTPVLGGPGGPSNTQAEEIANRTQKIKSILKENSIYIDNADFEHSAQNILFNCVFYATVSDGDFVYYHTSGIFYKAIAGGSGDSSKVIGMADVTNNRVIVNGVVQTSGLSLTPNGKAFLSATSSGKVSDVDTGVFLGYYISNGVIRLHMCDYIPSDPLASIPGLRSLGTGIHQACAGNDVRLFPTGGIIMWSGLITAIPLGWLLCNGLNGTPNLLDRFIIGVPSSGTNPGISGGSDTHSHAIEGHILNINEMPSHNHSYNINTSGYGPGSGYGSPYFGNVGHTKNTNSTGGNLPHSHGSTTSSHKPKYYTLAYIIKA